MSDKATAVYDSIDVAKGTARIIGNLGAGDLTAWLDTTWHALWMLERTPSGNAIITTVFPQYAEGTQAFVVLESRQSMAGQTILGEQSYGTCTVLE